ncbi:hypothetical protein KEM60_03341 [Austwickia sp. TVS 96-490-7B]|uniref:hypothetical protein n=1 Tax=Austwickia sp. TVS 96-490-7B TaxID=2830843 RepID=UPI001C55F5EE|nr:hypothetical protein [Austwickia sp. TVS 96-490-7B]MBW3087111.1 hypothetical protein [Austwickia sp. TVS 96-490-7B]
MTFTFTHIDGSMTSGNREDFALLLDELSTADDEHPDVSIQHESGLSLSIQTGWLLIVEDIEDERIQPVWTKTDNRKTVFQVMLEVAQGKFIPSSNDWSLGYGEG